MMNDAENEKPDVDEKATDESTPDSSESREAFKGLTDAAKEAFKAGAEDASDAVKRLIPETKSGARNGIHDLAYGLAYALTFGTTLLKEVTPDMVTEGFSEGSEAGKKAASDIVEKRKVAKEAAEKEEATDMGGAEPNAA
ncbi:MAG: hypothetical protein ACKVJU_19160 [Verrucomicrobiales bacterium]